MARPITTVAAGRVNRRFLFLALILAVLSAVLVYAAVSRTGGGESSAVDVSVVVAKADIAAGTTLTADLLALEERPSNFVSDGALSSVDAAVGRVAKFPIRAKEPLVLYDVVEAGVTSNDALSYLVQKDKLGMAINVEKVISAGGLILPGDHVDVLWIPGSGEQAYLLLSDIEVTAVEQTLVDLAQAAPGVDGGEEAGGATSGTSPADDETFRVRASDAETQPDAGTVTLLLTPPQTRNLFCAEWFAQNNNGAIRLAVRGFGDTGVRAPDAPTCPPDTAEEASAADAAVTQ